MKLVYTNENKIIVENTRNFLEESHIETELRNEYASGGMGELSPISTWPEIWVSDRDFLSAQEKVAELHNTALGDLWHCPRCQEENESTFEVCWRCQTERTP